MRLDAALVFVLIVAACVPGPRPTPSGDMGTLEVRAAAGPTCPVETEEPDPACESRPVAGARVFVAPADGRDMRVAQAVTDTEGVARIELAAGSYIVSGGDVEGLFGRPQPVPTDVRSGETTSIALAYDTGIR